MKKQIVIVFISVFLVQIMGTSCTKKQVSKHPILSLTQESKSLIKKDLEEIPLLQSSFDELKKEADKAIREGIDVPTPKDPAGAYTHNQHKANYMAMYAAGTVYQLTEDETYADFVREMLLEYARIYPTLPEHPVKKSYAPGKLFWQSLNEAVWMVYTSQAYDCIYDFLSENDRQLIENNLLFPYADFLSIESVKVFNRIHNHGVWAVAAVGMCGLATGNDELVERALYGVPVNGEKVHAGFLVQMDELFSPEGYYTEGPYYQRYALLPYVVFAQAVNNARPELKIFEYRNNILEKAVSTTLQLTNTDGTFFAFNDAMKGMSFLAPELVNALDIVYANGSHDERILTVARMQDQVILSASGYRVAKAIAEGQTKDFVWNSMQLGDGAKGDKGGLAVLRSGKNGAESALMMKYASHGLSHGHFDRLTCNFFDNGTEILTDYGSARYVNVVQKEGGRYLPENDTWAKQTIAHNTVTVNETSHFDADMDEAEKFNPEGFYYNADDPNFQVVSAIEKNAVSGVQMQRTMILYSDTDILGKTVVIDVFNLRSKQKNQYDLPWYYSGQFIYTNAKYNAFTTTQHALGNNYGYEHLWLEAEGKADNGVQLTFLSNYKFYSIHSETNENTEILMARIGADDPNFNLRREPCMIIREKNAGDHTFVSLVEPHGGTDPNMELTHSPFGMVKSIKNSSNDVNYALVEIKTQNDDSLTIAIALNDNKENSEHMLSIAGKEIKWTGFIAKIQNK
ncbi:MAG: heparinase II/III family protein [Prolixibacteraceae bacterium]